MSHFMKKPFAVGLLKKLILNIETTTTDPVFQTHLIKCHTDKAKRHLYYAVRELDKVNYMKIIEKLAKNWKPNTKKSYKQIDIE